jgi:hypothetical protein
MKIAFFDNSLCERGTSLQLYYYAHFNKTILNNESIIIYNSTRTDNDEEVIQRFKNEFDVFSVNNFNLVDYILLKTKCDILYIIKAGQNEGQISKKVKTVVHCVFDCNHPHGNVYAGVSQFIKGYKKSIPVVPHIIYLPDHNKNMREELNIPDDATVYGRHGGYDAFNILYVRDIVYKVAKENKDIYFLFLNTEKFCEDLPNIIHLKKIIDLEKKVEFINTCDAMLWARMDGESFGISIGEFSIKNKPIIATPNFKLNPKVDTAHIHFLKEKGIWYNEQNLYEILTTFITKENRKQIESRDWNAFKDYNPENVMKIFKNVFID